MKNIFKTTIIASLAIALGSCDLDLEPVSAIGENAFFNTTEEVEAGVIAMYDGLQDVVSREFALTEMRSGNTESRSGEGDWAQFESFEVRPTNVAITNYWTYNYNVIFRANTVLKHLDVVSDSSLYNQYEAEARFVRALAYFNLARTYGGVPLIDQVVIQSDKEFFERKTYDETMEFIVDDLEFAVDNLRSRSEMMEGRATSGAAKTLLAKVYLTLDNYADALPLLNDVTADADYALVDNYSDVFYNENNSEIIFNIQFVNDNTTESQDFSFEMTLVGAIVLNQVTDHFKAAVSGDDTERLPVLINPLVDTEVGKYISSSSNARQCGNDWIVLRLADALLLKAEAIMAGNASTTNSDAIDAYNLVRARVGLSTLATDGSETLTKDMLLNERRVELAFENHYIYDLIRFGEAENVLGAIAASNGDTFTPTDLIMPIPQREIDTSDGLLTQNPGYL
ncbi:RagB/SusD family nutrient uptake outer membrane protein [Marinoscillum sp. MHG1-6]|uniref:RagB/SusD family nutrient uptake outer membrane protein n=1 Tax=Marinoscillum sp. MHG1-6 TaxID=2959627 RepID=UPI00215873C0|nr:RagB/SusD family nutrient uptake outer membrane protein [Marinoscillum sp. MHG1-6]